MYDEEIAVEALAIADHDRDAEAWGAPARPHLWIDCNDEHRERYRALARRRLAEAPNLP